MRHASTSIIILPMGVCIAAVPLMIYLIKRFRFELPKNYGLLIGALVVNITYWFYTAPDFRFGSVFFFALPAVILAPAGYLLQKLSRKDHTLVGVAICFCLVVSAHIFKGRQLLPDRQSLFKLPAMDESRPVHTVKELEDFIPGLAKPNTGDQCGNSRLPCTPYINKQLRMFEYGDFAKGFYNKKM